MKCELLGTYGGDVTHALSAWTSTHRDLDPERRMRIPALLKMLAAPGEDQEEHGTPFEKSDIHFLVRVDTVTHYQILKHRIGVSANTESARYKELLGETCHIPEDWPDDMKQLLDQEFLRATQNYRWAIQRLEPLVGRKRAKESARFFLPLANELTMDVSFNFRSFVHFQRLRNHETAQKEINDLAALMLDFVRATGDFKYSLEAFGLAD